ncbi:MAG: RNA 2',3'-cyclic phosphodiesterase [Candidatus Dojkabacteria bacterium]|jgi:2'-5' RNA ligase|nr:RNA 2',3'-cyclic phosphodiesterase [Candidatus Dojkabacteria bacterium]
MRAFLAILPTKRALASLENIRTQAYPYRNYLRFVRSKETHLTLRYLGNNIGKPSIDLVIERLASKIATMSKFNLRIENAHFGFPDENWPRILYVSVARAEALDKLSKFIGDIVSDLDDVEQYIYDSGPVYHITLARAKRKLTRQIIADIKKRIKYAELLEGFLVERITLLNSTLNPVGPRYSTLAEFVLR